MTAARHSVSRQRAFADEGADTVRAEPEPHCSLGDGTVGSGIVHRRIAALRGAQRVERPPVEHHAGAFGQRFREDAEASGEVATFGHALTGVEGCASRCVRSPRHSAAALLLPAALPAGVLPAEALARPAVSGPVRLLVRHARRGEVPSRALLASRGEPIRTECRAGVRCVSCHPLAFSSRMGTSPVGGLK